MRGLWSCEVRTELGGGICTSTQPPVSPLKGGRGATVDGSAGRGAYRRVRDIARYGVAMV